MALPSRARRIQVDGVLYRWLAVGPGPDGTPVVVQAADGRGEKRVVTFQPGLNVTPGGVADAIRRLVADGWVSSG